MIGRVVEGKYNILREIGSGTMFTVYLAVNQISNEVVALKMLHPEFAHTGQFLPRLRREATLLEELDSPYAARIIDYGEFEGRVFLVQEYIPGRSLQQVLKEEGPLDVERALGVVQQIAQCIADASGVGLVHRDLRPGNIILTSGFSAKLVDFGVAVAADLAHVWPSGAVGLPFYLAPELALGHPGDVRADVYSLGVVLFEMLTGRVPFTDDEATAIILKHLQMPIPSVLAINPEMAPAVDRLIMRCLAKEPQDRYLPLELVRAIADLLGEVEVGPGVEGALAGQPIGRYQLLERIGRGGMAAVYKAYQSGLDRYVAIKVLPVYLAHDPRFLGRFRREARAIAQLNHPNILPVHDFGREGDLTYIVMKYVEGGTLKDLLGQPLCVERTVEIVSQVAAALDHAHARGIVHRDVKPGNVLMADTHWPLLSDFGLARVTGASVQYSSTGASLGTPDYISPEQAMGQSADARSDVYSLGVVIYEMLTGRVPFQAGTPMGVVIKHITAAPVPAGELNPALAPEVVRVIMKSLAKDPQDRYQSAGALVDALRVAARGEQCEAPSSANPAIVSPGESGSQQPTIMAPAMDQPPRALGRAPLIVAALVAALLLVVALTRLPDRVGPLIGAPSTSTAFVVSPSGAAMAVSVAVPTPTPILVTALFPDAGSPLETPERSATATSPAGASATPEVAAIAAATSSPTVLAWTSTPTATTATATMTMTATATATPTATAPATGTSTATPTATHTSSATPTPSTTSTATATATATATPTSTAPATGTSTATPTATHASSPTPIPTLTPTLMPTRKPSLMAATSTATLSPPNPVGASAGGVSVIATLPADLYPAPMLISPSHGYTTGDGRVSFAWSWSEPLGPDDCFELAMSGNPAGPFWGAVACQKAADVSFNVAAATHIIPGPGGLYYWTVRVNRQLSDGQWVTVSATSEPRELRLSSGGGGGGSGGSGGGGKGPPPPP